MTFRVGHFLVRMETDLFNRARARHPQADDAYAKLLGTVDGKICYASGRVEHGLLPTAYNVEIEDRIYDVPALYCTEIPIHSWRGDVRIQNDSTWHTNGARFETEQEAQTFVQNMKAKWNVVTHTRTRPTEEPVNWKWDPTLYTSIPLPQPEPKKEIPS